MIANESMLLLGRQFPVLCRTVWALTTCPAGDNSASPMCAAVLK